MHHLVDKGVQMVTLDNEFVLWMITHVTGLYFSQPINRQLYGEIIDNLWAAYDHRQPDDGTQHTPPKDLVM